ncbi:PQQ-binding-like beta-propeller repeat protein [Kitasatospora sp. NPDC006697]|uniref:outer membrane protein assembly factor BamB family protein n=1 Tax=Kitasatospora sp. NPDC006697 TaxID=3364020 RepID=UPI00369BA081
MAVQPGGGAPDPLWSYTSKADFGSSNLAVAGGRVYVVSDRLTAVDAATGAVAWNGEYIDGLLAAAGGGLVFVGSPNSLTGYDQATGKSAWRPRYSGPSSPSYSLVQALCADDELAYGITWGQNGLNGQATKLVAWSIESGVESWSQELRPGQQRYGVQHGLRDGRIYHNDGQFTIIARSTKDGQQLWSTPTGADFAITPVTDGDRLYCLAGKDGLQALSTATGSRQLLIRQKGGADGSFGQVTAVNGVVYGFPGDQSVCAWSAKTGEQLWECPLPFRPSDVNQPVLVQNTLFVVGTGIDGVTAVDAGSGAIRWRFRTDPLSSPSEEWALTTDGRRLFAGLGTTLFALPAS